MQIEFILRFYSVYIEEILSALFDGNELFKRGTLQELSDWPRSRLIYLYLIEVIAEVVLSDQGIFESIH